MCCSFRGSWRILTSTTTPVSPVNPGPRCPRYQRGTRNQSCNPRSLIHAIHTRNSQTECNPTQMKNSTSSHSIPLFTTQWSKTCKAKDTVSPEPWTQDHLNLNPLNPKNQHKISLKNNVNHVTTKTSPQQYWLTDVVSETKTVHQETRKHSHSSAKQWPTLSGEKQNRQKGTYYDAWTCSKLHTQNKLRKRQEEPQHWWREKKWWAMTHTHALE